MSDNDPSKLRWINSYYCKLLTINKSECILKWQENMQVNVNFFIYKQTIFVKCCSRQFVFLNSEICNTLWRVAEYETIQYLKIVVVGETV